MIDGTYVRRLDGFHAVADYVVLLNDPIWIVLPRLLKRSLRRAGKKDMLWGKNEESFRNFLELVWATASRHRSRVRRLRGVKHTLAEQGSSAQFIEFRRDKDAAAWVDSLKKR